MITLFEGSRPTLAEGVFVAEGAFVVGKVTLGAAVSVWYGAVVRGDINRIEVGPQTNIQDGAVIHVSGDGPGAVIGAGVTVGHRAVLHSCHIGDDVLVGISATVLDDVEVGEGSIIAAGSLLAPGSVFAPRSLIRGTPGKRIREVSADELAWIERSAERYVDLAKRHMGIAERQDGLQKKQVE